MLFWLHRVEPLPTHQLSDTNITVLKTGLQSKDAFYVEVAVETLF